MAGTLKVLIAEPNPVMRRVLELILTRDAIHVVALPDGAGAVDALPRERPDVVLADQALSHRDGYAIAAFVRSDPELSSIPVVLTAGAFEPVDRGRAIEAGCVDVFVKPYDPQRLVARVRQLAAGRPPAGEDADGYFERLSAALEARDRTRPPAGTAPHGTEEGDEGSVPTLESILRDRS